MNSDPLYQAIIKGLRGEINPHTFERCANSLLVRDWPTLAPVPGGSDGGMDGGIADGLGEPLPLICTTDKNPTRNLAGSLRSYVANRGPRREAVFVTARELSGPQQLKLRERARELGFTLLQVYEQTGIAERLYHDPRWCRELLGLTGDPPALSRLPVTRRPLISESLVGRQDDLSWLDSTSGDRLLVGAPGSGKTSVLYQLTKGGAGLFVVSSDLGAIAGGIRKQRPSLLIVDDAHYQLGLLQNLRHLRSEIGADFAIVASCWPGARDSVLETLGCPVRASRELSRLTRDEIVTIVKNVGIFGPPPLLREILNQAEGQPGLAVTLAHLCLQGSVQEVVRGDALSRTLLTLFEKLLGPAAVGVLTAYAVGGDRGLATEAVARILQIPRVDLQYIVTGLAAGGCIREAAPDVLMVRPRELRGVLVRDQCFTGPARLPFEHLLAEAPDRSEAIRTLLAAQAVGAQVDVSYTHRLLEQARRGSLWCDYAALGENETAYVLREHLEVLEDIVGPALYYAPERALPLLLDAECSARRPGRQAQDSPLRKIGDWITRAEPGTADALLRRRQLIRSVRRWFAEGKNSQIGFRALAAALSPRFERMSADPGSDHRWTITMGVLEEDELRALGDLWQEIRDRLPPLGSPEIKILLDMVRGLVFLYRGGGVTIPPEFYDAAGVSASQILRDLVPYVSGRPGFARRVSELTERIGIDVNLATEPDFEILFPTREDDDWRRQHEINQAAASQLAQSWLVLEPKVVAARIAYLDREATDAEIHGPKLTFEVCRCLAEKTTQPAVWARAFLETQVAPDLVAPFLWQSATRRDPELHGLLLSSLADTLYLAVTIPIILGLDPPAPLLLEPALPLLSEKDVLRHISLPANTPLATIQRLLIHDADHVAGFAAINLWAIYKDRQIPTELATVWQAAFLRGAGDDLWIDEILKCYPDLVHPWLTRQLGDQAQSFRLSGHVMRVLSTLDEDGRARLIAELEPNFNDYELLGHVIRGNMRLYQALLNRPDLHWLHLAPLGYCPTTSKADFIRAALDAGYDTDEVAHRLFPMTWGWSGSESAAMQEWINGHQSLCASHDSEIAAVARKAVKAAEQRRDKARVQERNEEIYGY